jgi:hypothetical protein
MRIVLSLLTIAAGAAAAVLLLEPGTIDELAVVRSNGAGSTAKLERPGASASSTGLSPTTQSPTPTRPTQNPVTSGKGLVEASSGDARFFGYALPSGTSAPPPHVAAGPDDRSVRSAPSKPSAWSTEVVVYPGGRSSEIEAAVVPASRVVAVAPAPHPVVPARDRPRHELVRELQRELKRVGCYWGETDGDWGPGSRRALRAFMERVNSSLQSEDPDLIQLTLVRGYAGNACPSGTVPAGPALTTAARLGTPPTATNRAAQPSREASVVPTKVTVAPGVNPIVTGATEPPSPARPPIDGRMAVGGPVPDPARTPSPGLTSAPVGAVTKSTRARPPQQAQHRAPQIRQSERSWTANFFAR